MGDWTLTARDEVHGYPEVAGKAEAMGVGFVGFFFF